MKVHKDKISEKSGEMLHLWSSKERIGRTLALILQSWSLLSCVYHTGMTGLYAIHLQVSSDFPERKLLHFNSLLKANLLIVSLAHFMSKEQNPQDYTSNKLFTLLLSPSENSLWRGHGFF